VLAPAAHAECDRADAPLTVEAPVPGAVLAQEVGTVALVAYGARQRDHLGAVLVGVVR
jgi:hypothetical protein